MSRAWWLARRAAFSLFALWIVVSVTFGFVAFTGDPGEAAVEFAVAAEMADSGASGEEIRQEAERAVQAYREARNLNDPVHERYVNWMVNVATLDFGTSYSHPTPVTTLIADRLRITMAYVLPGMAIALAGGVTVGTYSALGENRLLRRLSTGATYTLFGVPNFWIAAVAILVGTYQFGILSLTGYELERSVLSAYNLKRLALPAVLLGTGLVAEQARYVRSEVLSHENELFVRQVRAKGMGRLSVVRHVLRVSLVPLVSLFFANLLGVLVVNVFVIEFVFELPGFGSLAYDAIMNRNLPVITGMTIFVAGVGIVGNFLQDVAYLAFDPRIELGD